MLIQPVITTAFAFVTTLFIIRLTASLAIKTGLVDHPDHRKIHKATTPLTGGISIFIALMASLFLWSEKDQYLLSFVISSGILVLTGTIDDRKQLKVRYRILVEIVAASVMIFGAHLWVGNLGNLIGTGSIHMPFSIGYAFTIIAVFGIINAINMLDGLDGLAGGVTLSVFIVLLIYSSDSRALSTFGFPLAGALLAFLVSNTGVTRSIPKVFLGDAGSKMLGLAIVWVLIDIARVRDGVATTIRPASALYLVAIPLMDMVDTTVFRVSKGLSPFSPDRNHLHHILLDLHMSPAKVVLIIVATSLAFNLAGISMTATGIPEFLQFVFFLTGFITLILFKRKFRGKSPYPKGDSPESVHSKPYT